mmetsp:Transcript_41049/g.63197  ORF Transcript_41049/g.63197 Transcript_41049/m.63197 type:complete len:202 (+) Transcript_41049:439-1044(+)
MLLLLLPTFLGGCRIGLLLLLLSHSLINQILDIISKFSRGLVRFRSRDHTFDAIEWVCIHGPRKVDHVRQRILEWRDVWNRYIQTEYEVQNDTQRQIGQFEVDINSGTTFAPVVTHLNGFFFNEIGQVGHILLAKGMTDDFSFSMPHGIFNARCRDQRSFFGTEQDVQELVENGRFGPILALVPKIRRQIGIRDDQHRSAK